MNVPSGMGLRSDLQTLRRHARLIAWAHLTKLLVTLPAAVWVGGLVHGELAFSLEADRFAAALEPALLMELLRRLGPALEAGAWTLLAGFPLAGLVLVFIDGGLLGTFLRPSAKSPAASLFEEGGRAFGRLLRLLPLTSLVLVGLGLAPGYGLHRLALWLTEDWRDEGLVFSLRVTMVLVGLAVFLHVRASCGIARVLVVRGEPLRIALRSLADALLRPKPLLAAVLPWALLGGASTVLLSLIDVRISRDGAFMIAVGICVQQGSAFVRTLLRAGGLAALVRQAPEMASRGLEKGL